MSAAGRRAQDLDCGREFCIIGINPPFSLTIQISKTPIAIALDPYWFSNSNPLCLNTFPAHFSSMGVHAIT